MPMPLVTEDGAEVDLSKVDGWDAITYAATMGGNLEDHVLRLVRQEKVVTARDRSIVKWLWVRQVADVNRSIQSVAATVALIPREDPDDEPPMVGAEPEPTPQAGAPGEAVTV